MRSHQHLSLASRHDLIIFLVCSLQAGDFALAENALHALRTGKSRRREESARPLAALVISGKAQEAQELDSVARLMRGVHARTTGSRQAPLALTQTPPTRLVLLRPHAHRFARWDVS